MCVCSHTSSALGLIKSRLFCFLKTDLCVETPNVKQRAGKIRCGDFLSNVVLKVISRRKLRYYLPPQVSNAKRQNHRENLYSQSEFFHCYGERMLATAHARGYSICRSARFRPEHWGWMGLTAQWSRTGALGLSEVRLGADLSCSVSRNVGVGPVARDCRLNEASLCRSRME